MIQITLQSLQSQTKRDIKITRQMLSITLAISIIIFFFPIKERDNHEPDQSTSIQNGLL